MEVAYLANVPGVRGKLAKCDQEVGFWAQILIAVIIADVQRDDYGWVALVEDQLGGSKYIAQGYHHHGDNSVLPDHSPFGGQTWSGSRRVNTYFSITFQF